MAQVQLLIKLDLELKNAFISVCNSQDSTASQEIRKFMKSYIKKHGQQDLFQGVKK